MQGASHILEVAFEAGVVFGGLIYLFAWMSGRKLTNGQALLVFAIGFVASLLANLLSPVPIYVWLIPSLGPSFLRLVRRIGSLISKPLSNQIGVGSKKSALPEQPRLP